MKFIFYISITLMRLYYNIVRIINPTISFRGKCCCNRLNIKSVKGSTNNKIIFGKHVILKNCNIFFQGNNHTLSFGNNIKLENVSFFFEKDNSNISVGDGTWIGEQSELSAFDNSDIIIGRGSIFAKGCILRTSDSHIIMNDRNNIINKPENIIIGSHVWIGLQTCVLKGSVIPDGCIVGARSVVTSSMKSDEKSIIVGQPAKVIKKNISWEL